MTSSKISELYAQWNIEEIPVPVNVLEEDEDVEGDARFDQNTLATKRDLIEIKYLPKKFQEAAYLFDLDASGTITMDELKKMIVLKERRRDDKVEIDTIPCNAYAGGAVLVQANQHREKKLNNETKESLWNARRQPPAYTMAGGGEAYNEDRFDTWHDLDKDVEKTIVKAAIRLDPKHQMEPKLTDIISKLPAVTGVYYIHKSDGEIVYIGKSKNIKSRISQHFTVQTTKSKKIQLEVATVSYDETGSELVALLKESEEIKRNKPKFNRALRRTIFTHGLFSFRDANGYMNLKVDRIKGNQKPITTFSNNDSGKSFMNKIVEKHQLCQKLCGLYKTEKACFGYNIKSCAGACISEESSDVYNKRVLSLIDSNNFKDQNMILVDYGREVDERSAILIENGVFKGYAYFNLNFQINTTEVLKSILTPMEHNKDAQHIIQSFMRRHKRLKIIKLKD